MSIANINSQYSFRNCEIGQMCNIQKNKYALFTYNHILSWYNSLSDSRLSSKIRKHMTVRDSPTSPKYVNKTNEEKPHRRTHGHQTYVRRPMNIHSLSKLDCHFVRLYEIGIVKNHDAPFKRWKEHRLWLLRGCIKCDYFRVKTL